MNRVNHEIQKDTFFSELQVGDRFQIPSYLGGESDTATVLIKQSDTTCCEENNPDCRYNLHGLKWPVNPLPPERKFIPDTCDQ